MVDDYHVQQTNSYTFFTPRQFIIPTNAAKIQHLKLHGAKHRITYDRGPLWIKQLSRRAGKIVSNLEEFDVVNHPWPPSDKKIWIARFRNPMNGSGLFIKLEMFGHGSVELFISPCFANPSTSIYLWSIWDCLFYNENMTALINLAYVYCNNENMTAFNQFGLCLLQWETMTAFRLGWKVVRRVSCIKSNKMETVIYGT